jgi:hypothetical protein
MWLFDVAEFMAQFRIVLQLKNDLNNSSKVNLRDRREW